MTSIIHCSDLHFGAGFQRDRLIQLEAHIARLQPDAVVVSGDLTMRARPQQFMQAKNFFDRLQPPVFVVPGNHDIPLFNLFRRFVNPFYDYHHAVHGHINGGEMSLPGVSLHGLNTVNPRRHQQGMITRHQLAEIDRWSKQQPSDVWRIVVLHQHLQNAPGTVRPGRIPNAEEVVERFSAAGVHGVLYGHTHVPFVGDTRDRFPRTRRPLALVNAATVTCVRTRGITKANGFHHITFSSNEFRVNMYEWPQTSSASDFHPAQDSVVFTREFFAEPRIAESA